jgi:hypothetical protein
MNEGSKREREERALDALLVSALRRVDKDDDTIDTNQLPQLTEDEKAAMNALGNDFVKRLLAGQRPYQPGAGKKDHCGEDEQLAHADSEADFAFNRAEEVDDETAAELERQEREILERRAREQKERTDGSGETP